MATFTILNTPEDLEWLRTVHGVPASFAILHGHEDAPHHVETYDVAAPTIGDTSVQWRPDAAGVLRRVDA